MKQNIVYKRLLAIIACVWMTTSVFAQGICINKTDGTVIKIPAESIEYVSAFEEEDPRMDDVVPTDLREKMDGYMPFYSGINPPNIEGCYLVKPYTTVYCEGGHYSPGQVIDSYSIAFLNQDMLSNTVDMEKIDIDSPSDHSTGTGAFISGSENHFTIFFNTVGVTSGITNKTASIVSGIKTDDGIKDLYYGFVMVEKGSDPNGNLMGVGEFRVFKDGDGISGPYSASNSLYQNSPAKVEKNQNQGHSMVEGDYYGR